MRHVSLCCATVVAVATLSAAILYPKTPAPASPPSTAPSPQRGVLVSVGQLSIHWGAKEVAAAQPPPATPSQPLNALTRTAIVLSCVALAICMIGGMRLVFDEHAREIAALQERFQQALEELATDKLPQAEETNDEIEQLRATMDTHRRALRAANLALLISGSINRVLARNQLFSVHAAFGSWVDHAAKCAAAAKAKKLDKRLQDQKRASDGALRATILGSLSQSAAQQRR
uniref:Uncharacterized protein n=1 Tax=Haptolina ericina TaxID=156174 RepID=A0A7S3AE70_9EUKA|mmetsp:Transcript_14400/g.32355  ORF Transcript_14400/g.32355 Transcript_14400/m.32355 type:complete len:231 (+) Transcript_14400:44-736(+)